MSTEQLLITAAVAALGAIACGWQIPRAWRSDNRTHNDQTAAWRITRDEDRPEPGTPGTDSELYLDCIAIYGDCDELQRLRNAINETRKEKP